jgi:hypothetical protein
MESAMGHHQNRHRHQQSIHHSIRHPDSFSNGIQADGCSGYKRFTAMNQNDVRNFLIVHNWFPPLKSTPWQNYNADIKPKTFLEQSDLETMGGRLGDQTGVKNPKLPRSVRNTIITSFCSAKELTKFALI